MDRKLAGNGIIHDNGAQYDIDKSQYLTTIQPSLPERINAAFELMLQKTNKTTSNIYLYEQADLYLSNNGTFFFVCPDGIVRETNNKEAVLEIIQDCIVNKERKKKMEKIINDT